MDAASWYSNGEPTSPPSPATASGVTPARRVDLLLRLLAGACMGVVDACDEENIVATLSVGDATTWRRDGGADRAATVGSTGSGRASGSASFPLTPASDGADDGVDVLAAAAGGNDADEPVTECSRLRRLSPFPLPCASTGGSVVASVGGCSRDRRVPLFALASKHRNGVRPRCGSSQDNERATRCGGSRSEKRQLPQIRTVSPRHARNLRAYIVHNVGACTTS